jgi:hypothetical protein
VRGRHAPHTHSAADMNIDGIWAFGFGHGYPFRVIGSPRLSIPDISLPLRGWEADPSECPLRPAPVGCSTKNQRIGSAFIRSLCTCQELARRSAVRFTGRPSEPTARRPVDEWACWPPSQRWQRTRRRPIPARQAHLLRRGLRHDGRIDAVPRARCSSHCCAGGMVVAPNAMTLPPLRRMPRRDSARGAGTIFVPADRERRVAR